MRELSGTRYRDGFREAAVALLLMAYVILHFALSRLSLHQVKKSWGEESYFYLPLNPDFIVENERWLFPPHVALYWFFWPVRKMDQWLLQSPGPFESVPLMSLGGKRPQADDRRTAD